MRYTVIAALLLTGCAQPPQPPPEPTISPAMQAFFQPPVLTPMPPPEPRALHRLVADRTLACGSVSALVLLTKPDAHAKLGEFNWNRLALEGDCVELTGAKPVVTCYDKPPQPLVRTYTGPNPGARCRFVQRGAHGPKIGEVSD